MIEPGGIAMSALDQLEERALRRSCTVCQSTEAALDVVEAAQREEVVPLVVVERLLVAQPLPDGYGSESISKSYGS